MKVNYLATKPVGTCKVCGINLWKEHGCQPAPHTMPCQLEGCPHKTEAKILQFPRSSTGSALALLESH